MGEDGKAKRTRRRAVETAGLGGGGPEDLGEKKRPISQQSEIGRFHYRLDHPHSRRFGEPSGFQI